MAYEDLAFAEDEGIVDWVPKLVWVVAAAVVAVAATFATEYLGNLKVVVVEFLL